MRCFAIIMKAVGYALCTTPLIGWAIGADLSPLFSVAALLIAGSVDLQLSAHPDKEPNED